MLKYVEENVINEGRALLVFKYARTVTTSLSSSMTVGIVYLRVEPTVTT